MPDKPVEGKEIEIPINSLDAKLLESLRNPKKSLEPLGPLAGNPNHWLSEEKQKSSSLELFADLKKKP
ncbi:hypothetical protein PSH76_13515 [Pseudomonas sp. FP215]|uniref:hypothetical protein n=1 Tax=Pseudomonas sp. FP215 TaxID=2738126 RepID=UPI00273609AA|nr:hypothetical protein [Pseudomonas sp. FP215]WLH26785.1 hypothetical protein PSH76_13515 [Pseudomonas sp. FP215]